MLKHSFSACFTLHSDGGALQQSPPISVLARWDADGSEGGREAQFGAGHLQHGHVEVGGDVARVVTRVDEGGGDRTNLRGRTGGGAEADRPPTEERYRYS